MKMDQSTQVDFPVVFRKMTRNNTAGDLYMMANRGHTNSWAKLRPMLSRPRSLNLTTEPISPRSKVYSPEGPISLLSLPTSETPRERTPPFSSSASIASTATATYKLFPPMKPEPQVPPHVCNCGNRQIPADSPESLSWRNLHMSRAKLKATSTTSELLSGFAMVAMVELQINDGTSVPEWLFVVFAVCTTVLVSVHIFALMISTYILPHIDAISKLEISEMIAESPHERMRSFIELAWAFSTILGLFLFLVEVAILCWVKFWDYSFTAAAASTVVVIPVLVTFIVFVVHFYHSLVMYKCSTSINDMEKLEDMKKNLDQATSPV